MPQRIRMLLLALTLGLFAAGALLVLVGRPGPARAAAPHAGSPLAALDANGIQPKPSLILNDGSASQFGVSVASAGDVNNDGYADLVVGASASDSSAGRAYVYYGSATGLGATPSVTLTGEAAGDQFGRSVASAGDVNDDNYSDVIIGAPGHDVSKGRAYVYHGGPGGLSATPGLTLTGETTSDAYGQPVASAGDVNNDGFADVVIGARMHLFSSGTAYVYHGSASGLGATPAITLTAEGGAFGSAVATAGDVNADNYDDIVIGAPQFSLDTGRVYVYAGGAAGVSDTPAMTFTGETSGDFFGSSVSTAGDVNDDSYSDVAIGTHVYSSFTGRVYIHEGSGAGLSATPAMTLTGAGADYGFGFSVAALRDVNDDGFDDLVVGAPNYNGNTGQAYVFHGGASGLTSTVGITLTGEASLDQFGFSVAGAGDLNGDGYFDLVVGANAPVGGIGQAYVYYSLPIIFYLPVIMK